MADIESTSRRHFVAVAASAVSVALTAARPVVAMDGHVDRADAEGYRFPPATDGITPFEVHIPQGVIDDLRRRLRDTRWPDKEPVTDWSQGVPLASARALVEAWKTHDWRKVERRFNAFPQFRTRIDGLGIYFIHAKSPHPGALPMIMTHGWPGSVIEFFEVIERLTDPVKFGGSAADAFDVVVPALPGYGFSDKPTVPGWDVDRIADAWATLMKKLGYTRWVAQGGDWGTVVTHTLARHLPPGLVAAHVNFPLVAPAEYPVRPTPDEQRAIDGITRFQTDGSGYGFQQATRPQTVGYGFADSPVEQAMWIYEKFHAWTDNRGRAEDALSTEKMLDDISLYWFTNSGTSSARLYWEAAHGKTHAVMAFGPVDLPMAGTVFPREIYQPPRAWAEQRWKNLFYWNEVDRGGHFAAFEQPELFVSEVQKAFRIKGRGG